VKRVIHLPAEGRLLVATDIQGHLEDFERLEQLFIKSAENQETYLVVTGDLVHGPDIRRRDWPDYLGSFYQDDSVTVAAKARALSEAYPGKVFYLLGNHEHAHIGGPVVSKFFVDEAARLEHLLGKKRARSFRDWLSGWPLLAIAPHAGIAMLHGAPNAAISSLDDIEKLTITPIHNHTRTLDRVLANIIWARSTTTKRATAFLHALNKSLRVAVYGHDVAREGYAIDCEPLLCISTSFGCFDGDKLYLDWDLSVPVESARQLAKLGLRPLYGRRKTVHRQRFPWEKKLRRRRKQIRRG
jgi:hypothetical protein